MVHGKHILTKCVRTVGQVVSRKKQDEPSSESLARVLGLWDLSLLGVGSTLGVGVYVLAGSVAKTDAGPAVIISFLVAAFASALAGVCYAEFASRVPKAGSAYVYSYVTVGELAAFVIGWNLILEYVIGTASVAKAFSTYLDTMMDHRMSIALTSALPLGGNGVAYFPDFLSLGIVLVLTGLLAWGVKESALMNNVFTALNLITVLVVIIAGSFRVDPHNWSYTKEEIANSNYTIAQIANNIKYNSGEGGFIPFGVAGIMAGAAKCFFGFIGFDCVATTGEEAKNPQRDIPLAIVISLLVIFLSYFGISTVITLMVPYFEQDKDAPLVIAFRAVGLNTISIVVSVGAIFALCTSLLGAAFPLPRVLWAMANDGLLPTMFGYVSKHTQTPIISTIVSGLLAGIMSTFFDLQQLIDMMSIGTLLAYSIVSLCVLILRYRDPKPALYEPASLVKEKATPWQIFGKIVNVNRLSTPDKTTTRVTEIAIGIFTVLTFYCTIWLVVFEDSIASSTWQLVVFLVVLVITCLPVLVIALQPQYLPNINFKVPMIPYLPCLSIFINIYLMMKLDGMTWLRFLVWLFIGGVIYLFYSISHSVEGKRTKQLRDEKPISMR